MTLNFESVDEIPCCEMKALCLYSHIVLFVFQNFTKRKFANLVEICFWLRLALKGFIHAIKL